MCGDSNSHFTVYCFRFRHPNLVTLLGYSNDVGKPRCLIYEFMPNGTLEDALELGVCQSTHIFYLFFMNLELYYNNLDKKFQPFSSEFLSRIIYFVIKKLKILEK